MGNETSAPTSPDARTVKMMDLQMREKLGKGEKWNMKIVLCGDSCTGKTSLFMKLQGFGAGNSSSNSDSDYKPTMSLQCGHVHWKPKRCDDVVKVEVWDLPTINKANQGQKLSWEDAVKLDTKKGKKMSQGSYVITELAQEMDVKTAVKNAQAVLLTINPKKRSTFNFAQTKLLEMPPHIHVCVLGLFHDEKDKWEITTEDMKRLTDSRKNTHFFECSTASNFGLQVLYSFLELPFLTLQRDALLKRLELNSIEVEVAENELRQAILTSATTNTAKAVVSKLPTNVSESSSDSDDQPTRSSSQAPKYSGAKLKPKKPAKQEDSPPKKKRDKESSKQKTSSSKPKSHRISSKTEQSPAKTTPKEDTVLDTFVVGDLDNNFFGSDDDKPPKPVQTASKPHTKPRKKSLSDDEKPAQHNLMLAAPDDSDSADSNSTNNDKNNNNNQNQNNHNSDNDNSDTDESNHAVIAANHSNFQIDDDVDENNAYNDHMSDAASNGIHSNNGNVRSNNRDDFDDLDGGDKGDEFVDHESGDDDHQDSGGDDIPVEQTRVVAAAPQSSDDDSDNANNKSATKIQPPAVDSDDDSDNNNKNKPKPKQQQTQSTAATSNEPKYKKKARPAVLPVVSQPVTTVVSPQQQHQQRQEPVSVPEDSISTSDLMKRQAQLLGEFYNKSRTHVEAPDQDQPDDHKHRKHHKHHHKHRESEDTSKTNDNNTDDSDNNNNNSDNNESSKKHKKKHKHHRKHHDESDNDDSSSRKRHSKHRHSSHHRSTGDDNEEEKSSKKSSKKTEKPSSKSNTTTTTKSKTAKPVDEDSMDELEKFFAS